MSIRTEALMPCIGALLALLVVGCSTQPEGAEYFWTPADFQRVYDVRMVLPGAGTIAGTLTLRGEGTTEVAGHTYHKTVATFEGLPGFDTEVTYSRLASDGIYSRSSPDPSVPETLEIPLPPDLGRKWSSAQDDVTMEMEVTAIEDCEAGETSYERCLEITGSGSKAGVAVKDTSYYAPEIGLVKVSMEIAGALVEVTLQSD